MIPSSRARTLLLLVIVSEFAEHIVTGLETGKDFLQTVLREESIGSQSALTVVGNADLVTEPYREHLSPRSPGFTSLVNNSAVATEEEGNGSGVGLYRDALNARIATIDFDCQAVIPREGAHLAGLNLYDGGSLLLATKLIGRDIDAAFVDHERASLHLTPTRQHLVLHETAVLCTKASLACMFLAAHDNSDTIIAISHRDREIVRIRETLLREIIPLSTCKEASAEG